MGGAGAILHPELQEINALPYRTEVKSDADHSIANVLGMY